MKTQLLTIVIYWVGCLLVALNSYGMAPPHVRFNFHEDVLKKGKIELILSVYSDYINEQVETYDYRKDIIVTDSLVEFNLPVEQDLSFLTVSLLIDNKLYLFEPSKSMFLLERYDSLKWEIGTEAVLTEKGAQKNSLRQRLAEHLENDETSWMQQYLVQGNPERYFEIVNEYYDAIAAKKVAYLDQLNRRYQLRPEIYEFMREECVYAVETRRVFNLIISMSRPKNFRDQTNPYLRTELDKIKDRYWHIRLENPMVLRFFRNLVILEERLSHNFVASSKDHVPPNLSIHVQMVSEIPSNYIRERLYPILFSRFQTGSVNGRMAIDKALDDISDPKIRNLLGEIREIRYSYADVFPFQLEDMDGRVYTPESFRGKKVVFDFWFTGCIWCSNLHPSMVAFEKELNDFNILFVTVSVDTNKQKWKRGIDEGIYTEKDGINLRLMDESRDMLSYYGYAGFPQLLVMDEQGRLLEFNVPIPVNQAKRDLFKAILYSR